MVSSMMKIEENAAIDGPVGSAGGRSPSTRPTGQAPPILTAGIGLMPMLYGMGNWLLRPRRFRHGAAAAGGDVASEVALPSGAPCGGLDVSAACTLCLACTRACPTGALEGEPRSQVLTFQESACGPCGLCAAVCPEQAITLRPRLSPDAALRRVLVQDEVAICARCGRPCGGRRTIERVIARLRQVSPGLPQRGLERLRSCDPCRIGC
jgi:ferredoxin